MMRELFFFSCLIQLNHSLHQQRRNCQIAFKSPPLDIYWKMIFAYASKIELQGNGNIFNRTSSNSRSFYNKGKSQSGIIVFKIRIP